MVKLKPIIARLSEKSTIIGILSLVTMATGYAVAPAQADAISTAVAAVASLALVWVKEAP